LNLERDKLALPLGWKIEIREEYSWLFSPHDVTEITLLLSNVKIYPLWNTFTLQEKKILTSQQDKLTPLRSRDQNRARWIDPFIAPAKG